MNRFRKQRFRQFFERFNVTPDARIIDVGGLPYDWVALSWPGEVLCVSLANLSEGAYGQGNILFRHGNALDLKPDNYDLAYSNSMLEHVGCENQEPIARKIEALAPHYWVQVPYRYTPLEPHYLFPCFWWFPHAVRRFVANHYTPLLVRHSYYLCEIDTIHLPDYQEMRQLFPRAEILRERVAGLTKSLIAAS